MYDCDLFESCSRMTGVKLMIYCFIFTRLGKAKAELSFEPAMTVRVYAPSFPFLFLTTYKKSKNEVLLEADIVEVLI